MSATPATPTPDDLRSQLGLADNECAERLLRVQASMASGTPWAVFAGAGVSRDAGLPDWVSLVEQVSKHFAVSLGPGGARAADLPLALGACLNAAVHPDEFWDLVSNLVCVGSPGILHRLLVRLPYAVLATTNFDCLLDDARQDELSETAPVEIYPYIHSTQLSGGVHAYLHGRCQDIAGGGHGLDPDACVLARDHYDRAYGDPVLPHAITSIFLDYPILFVGVSFNDHDIQHLLTTVDRLEADAGRSGMPRRRHRRFALEPGAVGDLDIGSAANRFRVSPIRFLNPSNDFAALVDILDWLNATVPPRASFGGKV